MAEIIYNLFVTLLTSPSQVTEIFQKMLTDIGPIDTQWNFGLAPVHYSSAGANMSVHFETGLLLKNFVEKLKPERILELGTFRGYSTSWLALGCLMIGKGSIETYDVNPEGTYGPMFYHLYHLPKIITYRAYPLWEDVGNLGGKLWDLVFHDSSHEIFQTVKELEIILPRMNDGGVILFDDVLVPQYGEMSNYLREFFSSYPRHRQWRYRVLNLGHGLGIAEKL